MREDWQKPKSVHYSSKRILKNVTVKSRKTASDNGVPFDLKDSGLQEFTNILDLKTENRKISVSRIFFSKN